MKSKTATLIAAVILLCAPLAALALGEPVQAAKAETLHISLWQFLMRLPGTMEAQIFYALLLGGFFGMLAHYVRGKSAGNIAGNPLDYFVRDNLWRSLAAAGVVAGELFSEVGTGLFTTDAGEFVGWGVVILSGLKTGYLGDSAINKGKRPEWTDEKRDAVVAAAAEPEAKKP